MKHTGFVIFLSMFLVLYAAVNALIIIRARQALSGLGAGSAALLTLLVLWMLAYPLGRLLEPVLHNGWLRFLIVVGSVYLGFMAYAFLFTLLAGLAEWTDSLFHWFSAAAWKPKVGMARLAGALVFGLSACAVLAGFLNASRLRVRALDIRIEKPGGALPDLKLVAVSDLHLGTVLGKAFLTKVARTVNGLNPDVVLLVGDTFDEDVTRQGGARCADALRILRSKYGVFAVLGNHEYYHSRERSAECLKQAGITLLEDSTVGIAGSVFLIGRKDRTAEQLEQGRKPIPALLEGVDTRRPLILLDHQPFHLERAEQAGVDLQVSGHTHHGQLFPFNWITNAVYELSWGHVRKGNTHFVVSCGAGTWGPPVRTAGVPEVWAIRLRFAEPRGGSP